MNQIIFWNARGAGGDKFRLAMKDILSMNKIDVLIVCEPRIQFCRAKDFFLKLGFDGSVVSEAAGFSGGLWVLWNKEKLLGEMVDIFHQAVTVKFFQNSGSHWLLTAVYASPINSSRSQLWEHIDCVSQNAKLPWMVIGDFNELLSHCDKIGGAGNCRFGGMQPWVARNGMIDMGYYGADYTWANSYVKERLDRGFCDNQWRLLFPEAIVRHLARIKSDHCPILVQLQPHSQLNRRGGPFRFQAMWLKHENFLEVLTQVWNAAQGDLLLKSKFLANSLLQWNKDVFGNIFKQKKILLARICGIQRSIGRNSNPFLLNLEKKLIIDYNVIRDAESLFWRQKSRDRWLQEGDRNTKFFHLTTIIRRRRNKIMGLDNAEGVYSEELEVMQNIAADYFQHLFSAQAVANQVVADADFSCSIGFPDIPRNELEGIGAAVSVDEIHDSLFNIGRLKAPGHDGFPAGFFQDHWDTCGLDIIKTVSTAFDSGSVPDGLNHTLIALVAKSAGAKSMNLFRPISLCCTIYKVISKIIVARLRPFLGKWISPNQVSFVPGRHISDNICIGQELLHKFKCYSGKKGYMAWKIDLSKAYDKLNWNFIFQVLAEIKIPDQICRLIKSCVSTASFQVLVNGSLSRMFSGSRGVRQGDPLSPYLFVLCMEKLSHLIQNSVLEGQWKAVKATRFGPHVSHLFFADDLILFAEASPAQAKVLKKTMDIFCSNSGQSVNFEKSVIFCSSSVSKGMARDISSICGSPLTSGLGNYLGMPLIHSKVGRDTYSNLIDKVQSRLASWKCKTLNLAGRLTLIQSVNAAIPVYAMQTAKLPISVCDKLDGLNRGFLWGDTADKKKVHLINWQSVCRPKLLGGLGIKRTRDMNQAMLAKASWRIFQGDEGLWSRIYKNKYLVHSSIFQNYKKPVSCSSSWSSLVHGADLFRKGLKWRIGNGAKVRFWKDNWSGIGNLEDFAICSSFVNESVTVNAFWAEQMWDVARLSAVLPLEVVEILCAIPVGSAEVEDKLIWGATSSGDFSVKSAYMLNFADSVQTTYPWMNNWSLNVPPKIKIFLWTLMAGKILTNVQRVSRNFTMNPYCLHCPSSPETLIHLFRDCPHARLIWDSFSIPAHILPSFSLDWKGWMTTNLLHKRIYGYKAPWNVVFTFVCWHLWKWRCKCSFEENFNMPYDVREVILSYLEEWRTAAMKVKGKSRQHGVVLGWIKPPKDVFKINVDGARCKEGNIGAGGVLRDCEGNWCAGFMAKLGAGDVLQAEAWALLYGLQMGLRKEAMKVEVEADCAILVKLILGADISNHPLSTIVLNCRKLMEEFVACSLRYVPREVNAVADCLAKSSLDCSLGVRHLGRIPDCCAMAVHVDMRGKRQQFKPSSTMPQCSSSNAS